MVFFTLPYFIGFQLFGLIVAQEAQNQVDNKNTNKTNQAGKQKIGLLVSEIIGRVRFLVVVFLFLASAKPIIKFISFDQARRMRFVSLSPDLLLNRLQILHEVNFILKSCSSRSTKVISCTDRTLNFNQA